jgi:hypothetical protein
MRSGQWIAVLGIGGCAVVASNGPELPDTARAYDAAVVVDFASPPDQAQAPLFASSGGFCANGRLYSITVSGMMLGFASYGSTPSGCNQTFTLTFNSATATSTGGFCVLGTLTAVDASASTVSFSSSFAGSPPIPACAQTEMVTLSGLTVSASGGVCPNSTVTNLATSGNTLSITTATTTPSCSMTRQVQFSR